MQTALIWGASGGIGWALTELLRAEGWRVLAVARDDTRLAASGVEAYAADLGRPSDVAGAALWAAQQTEAVDLWVYAAGAMLGMPLADTSSAEWDRILSANLTGAHLALTSSLPLVPAGGHLAFVGAYSERLLLPKIGAYAAAKAALDAYVTVLGKELRDRRVTNMRLGAADTPLWDDAPFRLPKSALAPADVAAALLRAHRDGHKGVLEL